jgi:periplasmic protein TonB
MFEQALLTNGPAGKRVWTTCMGVTSQAMLVGSAILLPLIWPEALPKPSDIITIIAPGPPPPPPPGEHAKPRSAPAPLHQSVFHPDGTISLPRTIPMDPVRIIDEAPPEVSGYGGVPGGTGVPGGVPGGVADSILKEAMRIMPVVPRVAETPRPIVHPAPTPAAPVPIGSRVLEGKIVSRVDPRYPILARQMRISGVVELVAIVGTDGHVREVKLVSGHPILAKAAMDAVWNWVYRPTLLNEKPVEVTAPVTVTFRLN